jgi:hypothetical protein
VSSQTARIAGLENSGAKRGDKDVLMARETKAFFAEVETD